MTHSIPFLFQKENVVKYSVVLLLAVASCSIKVTTAGRALVANKTVEDVFSLVIQAVSDSEFTVVSVNQDMGFISATRAGGIMTSSGRDIAINCKIRETADGDISVDVTSTLGGQMVAYGMTKDAIKVLFRQLAIYLPDARLTIDGKPFN